MSSPAIKKLALVFGIMALVTERAALTAETTSPMTRPLALVVKTMTQTTEILAVIANTIHQNGGSSHQANDTSYLDH